MLGLEGRNRFALFIASLWLEADHVHLLQGLLRHSRKVTCLHLRRHGMLWSLPAAKHMRLCTLDWGVLLCQISITQKTAMLALAARMQQDLCMTGEMRSAARVCSASRDYFSGGILPADQFLRRVIDSAVVMMTIQHLDRYDKLLMDQ